MVAKLTGLLICALMTGCATQQPPVQQAFQDPLLISQLPGQDAHEFTYCLQSQCPARTVKTLDTSPLVTSSALPSVPMLSSEAKPVVKKSKRKTPRRHRKGVRNV